MVHIFLIASFSLSALTGAPRGVIVDRVVATVNHHAILGSDVQEEVRFEQMMDGQTPGQGSDNEQRSALNRLIDRELLREQMHEGEVKPATAEEIDKQVADLKSRLGADTQSWTKSLARYEITEEELRRRIALQLDELRLVDLRLRPAVQIEPGEVKSYYQERFLPQVRQSGAQPMDESEAAPKVREILTQQKVNQLLNSWLETLHNQAEINILPSDTGEAGSAP